MEKFLAMVIEERDSVLVVKTVRRGNVLEVPLPADSSVAQKQWVVVTPSFFRYGVAIYSASYAEAEKCPVAVCTKKDGDINAILADGTVRAYYPNLDPLWLGETTFVPSTILLDNPEPPRFKIIDAE